jgi:hypothetical protein
MTIRSFVKTQNPIHTHKHSQRKLLLQIDDTEMRANSEKAKTGEKYR